jgi:hypothetical protein
MPINASAGTVGEVVPTVVHVVPSCDTSPVTVSPPRDSLNHTGNVATAPAT